MKRWITAGALLLAFGSLHADDRLDQLEQKIKILERKYEISQEEAAAKAKDGSSVSAKDGFQIKTNDGASVLKITGYVQTDHREFLSDRDAFPDQFLLRRVRTSIEGTINKTVDFRVLPDLANGGGTSGSSLLQDAYVELKTFPAFKVRAGKFKGPFSLERLQSGTAIAFVERAFPTSLAPNRDVGIQVSGDFWDGAFSYQAGLFDGAVDGASIENDVDDSKDVLARVFTHPFRKTSGALKDLGLGFAASAGEQKGTAAASQLPSYRTGGQNTFFSYRSGDTFAFGDRRRWSPQGYLYTGPWSLSGEYTVSTQDVRRGTTTATATTASLSNRGWVVAASYVLSGEKTSFRGVKPRKVFDPKTSGWGALELVGRVTALTVDEDAFPRYANIATAARSAKAFTGGFNWFLTNAVKVSSNYEYTVFDGGAAAGRDRRPERVILTRVQLVY